MPVRTSKLNRDFDPRTTEDWGSSHPTQQPLRMSGFAVGYKLSAERIMSRGRVFTDRISEGFKKLTCQFFCSTLD